MHEERAYIVRLSPILVDRVEKEILQADVGRYKDLSDFIGLAIANQLTLELTESVPPRAECPVDSPGQLPNVLVRMPDRHQCLTAPAVVVGEPLFVLTNRLSPMAMAVRVLANMSDRQGVPLKDFLKTASSCARHLGLRVREEDQRDGRRGLERRYIGWPVGDDESKALERFRWSFLLADAPPPLSQGPLAECGLAAVHDGRVVLTDAGLALALAPSPLLGEVAGWTLSTAQQAVLRQALLATPGERAAIAMFLDAVAHSGGTQPELDALVRAANPGWTDNRVTAHRAAMLGRLRELGVLDAKGWGSKATVTVAPDGEDFVATVNDYEKMEAGA